MPAPVVVDHPLVRCHLTVLRDQRTDSARFRNSVRALACQLAFSATADLVLDRIPVTTPLATTDGFAIGTRVGLVPIIRAGIGMVEPLLDLIPTSEVWHLGMYRDESTAQPVHYYSKLETAEPVEVAFVLDPMLATGGSACMAIDSLRRWGVPRVKLLAIISAPEGIQRVQSDFPEVEIHTCVVDDRLDERHFIVPGLGDAGDRIFNTPTR